MKKDLKVVNTDLADKARDLIKEKRRVSKRIKRSKSIIKKRSK